MTDRSFSPPIRACPVVAAKEFLAEAINGMYPVRFCRGVEIVIDDHDVGVGMEQVLCRVEPLRLVHPVVAQLGHALGEALVVAAVRCDAPEPRRARLAFHLQPGSYNDQRLIGVLGQLRRFLGGQKATLLWDGLPAHRSRIMQAFVRSQRGWLVVERLPGYAPELNPVEGVWANLKGQEFANYAADTLDDLAHHARRGITRVRRRPPLLFAFLGRTGLSL